MSELTVLGIIVVFAAIAAWLVWQLFKPGEAKPQPDSFSAYEAIQKHEFDMLERDRLITKDKLVEARLVYLKLRNELADIEAKQSGIMSRLNNAV